MRGSLEPPRSPMRDESAASIAEGDLPAPHRSLASSYLLQEGRKAPALHAAAAVVYACGDASSGFRADRALISVCSRSNQEGAPRDMALAVRNHPTIRPNHPDPLWSRPAPQPRGSRSLHSSASAFVRFSWAAADSGAPETWALVYSCASVTRALRSAVSVDNARTIATVSALSRPATTTPSTPRTTCTYRWYPPETRSIALAYQATICSRAWTMSSLAASSRVMRALATCGLGMVALAFRSGCRALTAAGAPAPAVVPVAPAGIAALAGTTTSISARARSPDGMEEGSVVPVGERPCGIMLGSYRPLHHPLTHGWS